MTADEAIRAVQECAYLTGAGAESAALTEDARAAQAAIREAFVKAGVAARARAELARLEAELDDTICGVTRVIAELQRDMLRRIIDGEGS